MFAELHTHNDVGSNTRLIDTTCKVDAILDTAVSYGFQGVAITDHESLSAHIKAIQKHKKIVKTHPDFKLILGNEIYLIEGNDYKNTNRFYHFILLAKDVQGHRQLRQLSTRAWGRVYSYKNVERVPTFYSDLEEIVGAAPGHLIAMTACLGGYLPMLMLYDHRDEALRFAEWCTSLFGKENFYIELQPGISEEQTTFNTRAIQFCKQHGFEWVITNDVHYLTADKRQLHAAFLSSKNEDREAGDFYESTYFKTEDEMLSRMAYLEKDDVLRGFANTVHITSCVEQYDLAQDVVVPQRPLPTFELAHTFHDWYSRCEFISDFAHSEYAQDRYLLYLVERGFAEKHQPLDEVTTSRIDIELKQLWLISKKLNQRLSSYYNLVRMIVDLMWDDNKGNSLVGPARGSVTGYYIAYLMGITQINPLDWDLPYWRHLVADRPELPD